ncbi:MAG: hypothetical protein RLO17_08570 [Cyclobacteriaceae bacterium]
MKKILFLLAVSISGTLMAQEGSVGIGTLTPNEKAVLHLVAPTNDQGFLAPKLTTIQRNNFSSQLTPNENGMMVFDSDLNQFFFWLTDHWEAVGSSLQAGAGVEIIDGVITNTGDTDASDDFSGMWNDLTGIPAGFLDGTDDVDDGDSDPTNELQDLNLSGNTLTITGLSTPTAVDLSPFLGTNTDEQDLQFNAGQISLTGDPDNTIIDLSGYDSDAADDFSGDWADLQNIPPAFADNIDDVDDADNDPTNEIELPATAGTNDVLVFDGASWVAGTDQVDDADNDPTNEIELPATAGTNDVLIFDGASWVAGTDQVDDADNNPNNEIELPLSNDADGNTFGEFQTGNYVKALNYLSEPVAADFTSISVDILDISPFKFARTLLFTPDGKGSTIRFIQVNNGISGQELILINVGSAFLELDAYSASSNLYLPLNYVYLNPGGSIHLMYVDDGKGIKGWITISISQNDAPGTAG